MGRWWSRINCVLKALMTTRPIWRNSNQPLNLHHLLTRVSPAKEEARKELKNSRPHHPPLPSMIPTFDVQQPIPQDPTKETTCHVIFLKDIGVIQDVLDGCGVGDE